jgi:hypothetical protein
MTSWTIREKVLEDFGDSVASMVGNGFDGA